MNILDANKIFRKSIIKGFFEPELMKLDFKKSNVNHPSISDDGLMKSNLLHIFFDIEKEVELACDSISSLSDGEKSPSGPINIIFSKSKTL